MTRPPGNSLEADQRERGAGGLLVGRDHRGHRVADVAHAPDGERVLVLRHRHDAVGNRELLTGQHQVHAGMLRGARDVDRLDFRVRMRRAQPLAMQHARQDQVVGEAQLAGGLGAPVDAPAGLAYGVEIHERSSLKTRAASSIDSQICW